MLAESGDDPARYASAKARKNYAGTSPITGASGKKKTVLARYVHNDRLIDALMSQAFTALRVCPGARAYYDLQRARGFEHNPALRQLANRLVGILHGCLKTRTLYDQAHRLAAARSERGHGEDCGLTFKLLGCLSCPQPSNLFSSPFQAAKKKPISNFKTLDKP